MSDAIIATIAESSFPERLQSVVTKRGRDNNLDKIEQIGIFLRVSFWHRRRRGKAASAHNLAMRDAGKG